MTSLQSPLLNLSLDDPPAAEHLLHFDSSMLVALGVPPIEADLITQMLITKYTMLCHWRKLSRAGVPKDNARRIARAIAKYDVSQVLPNSDQQQLIRNYCPIVCRCGLWRSQLLLSQPRRPTPVRSKPLGL